MKSCIKKALAVMLSAALALCVFAGCSKNDSKKVGQAENEILTYEPIDPEKTTLMVSFSGNIFINGFCEAFEEKNPDVQIIAVDIAGGNSMTHPERDWIKNGQAPDLMFSFQGSFTDEETLEYFEDLSANPVIANYVPEALNRTAIEGRAYWLPGPSNISCMIYNKTMFEQYGWQTPKTFDEFVALCLQIREDTDGAVQPWNPNAKYENEFKIVTEAFLYEELYAGLENRTWYNEFVEGEETAEHLLPYFEAMKTLIDNGLLLEEHFSYSATTRGKEFAAGQIAMYNYSVSNFAAPEEYEFDYMPFPSTKGESGYICDAISARLGVPKKEHTEAEKDAIQRYIEFFSSVEGQQAYIGELLMVSNVKGVPLSGAETLSALQETIEQGRMFEMLEFKGTTGKKDFSLYSQTHEMMNKNLTPEQCIAEIDEREFLPLSASQVEVKVIASASESFTMLETSSFIADFYRETAGADIGLIVHGQAYRGNLMKIFAGDITDSNVTVLKPRSFAGDSALTKVTMTGQQILDTLNDPVANKEGPSDTVYAFSGLKCEVAPWKALGEKYLSVALADGTPLELDKLYTVAFWGGTVREEHITEVVETFEGTWEELMTARLQQLDPIVPAKDERITLVWD